MLAITDFPKLDYPEGSSLVDVRYCTSPERFEVIFLNPILGKLDVKYEEALIDIWFLKKEFRTNKYQISQTEIEKAYKIICKPSQVGKMIAREIDNEEWRGWYTEHSGYMSNRDINKHMCECPWVFKGDLLPDVYFRLRWLKQYGRDYDVSKVTYGLLDIEIDVLDRSVDMSNPNDVTQPVNAVTVILPHEKICSVNILSPRKLRSEYGDLDNSFSTLLSKQKIEYDWVVNNVDEFKRMIVEDDPDNAKYLKGYRIDVNFFDYDREIDLIACVFQYINKYRPMFLMSWNAPFDHNYLMNRISYKGYDPLDFFVPEGIETAKLYYHKDNNLKSGLKNSRDWFFVSSYTTYLCQERLFAAIRKSQSEQRSYSLNYIGKKFAKINKLGDTKSGKFREFAYTDFIKFILYNVRDVVVQLAIETVCSDCKSLMSRSYMFATQFSKCFQETHIVRNIREYYYENIGFIQACTLLVDEGIDTHFKGAFVADPALNDVTGYKLNFKDMNNIIFAAWDADAKSYYPSTKMGCNLDPMALEYKCIIPIQVFENMTCTNRSFNRQYRWLDSDGNPHDEDIAAPLLNSFKNGNECSVLFNYFNLPSITEYIDYIDINRKR